MIPCDHVTHRATPVPASTMAYIAWTGGDNTVRALCTPHADEFRDLLARGATAFGAIKTVEFGSL